MLHSCVLSGIGNILAGESFHEREVPSLLKNELDDVVNFLYGLIDRMRIQVAHWLMIDRDARLVSLIHFTAKAVANSLQDSW